MKVNELINKSQKGINEIKLRQLLELRQEINNNPIFKTMFPPVEMGSITLADQIVLLALVQIVSPKKIIEVGTFLGFTTTLLSMNTEAEIISIDLPKSNNLKEFKYDINLIEIDHKENDNFLRYQQCIKGEVYLQNLTDKERERVKLVKSDSTHINFLEKFGVADFIFIDGGHEMNIIKKDTFNARSIVSDGVIIWHDFSSKIHTEVTKFLKREKNHHIFHVKGSLCAFEFITNYKDPSV